MRENKRIYKRPCETGALIYAIAEWLCHPRVTSDDYPYGSAASRRPSPMKLNPSTAITTGTAGNMIQG
jgi:hypothetical protein